MKRITLFLLTNLAVIALISFIINIFGLNYYLSAQGIDYKVLLLYSLVIGFAGSFISLMMSKTLAKASVGAQIIDPDQPKSELESWLLRNVHELADKAGIGRPEVAIYEGPPNAFATGASRNDSLVAVSTGLIQSMTREEVKAVLGHEIAHIANGDMVTSALLQGVLNTFVVFLSRVVAFFIDSALSSRRDSDDESYQGHGMAYFLISMVLELVFGIFASMIVAWFSRQREYRADAGSAKLLHNKQAMIQALRRLGGLSEEASELPNGLNAFGIAGGRLAGLFASHPPIEDRIQALENQSY